MVVASVLRYFHIKHKVNPVQVEYLMLSSLSRYLRKREIKNIQPTAQIITTGTLNLDLNI
jgi:hypothetical protein